MRSRNDERRHNRVHKFGNGTAEPNCGRKKTSGVDGQCKRRCDRRKLSADAASSCIERSRVREHAGDDSSTGKWQHIVVATTRPFYYWC